MANISRKNFQKAYQLIERHPSFFQDVEEKAIDDLLNRCDTEDKYVLVDELISQFYLMEHDIYNLILTDLARHIVSIGYPVQETAILALAHDSRPDSSESVIRDLYVPLFCEKHILPHELALSNKFGKLSSLYKLGKKHFFVVDEFIGSGQTAINCYKEYQGVTGGNATIEFLYVAGMKEGINNLKLAGAEVYCPWIMTKAIDDHYTSPDNIKKKSLMLDIESTLAPVIKGTKLSDHSLGYRNAQAVYSMRGSNTPNSTFPLFWWYKDSQGNDLSTVLLRVQNDF